MPNPTCSLLQPLTQFSLAWLTCLALSAAPALAQKFDERFTDWPLETRLNGTVVWAAGAADLKPWLAEHSWPAATADLVYFGMTDQSAEVQSELKELGISAETQLAYRWVQAPPQGRDLIVQIDEANWNLNDFPGFRADVLQRVRTRLKSGGTVVLLGESASQLRVFSDCRITTAATEGQVVIPQTPLEQPQSSLGIVIPSGTSLVLSGRTCTCYGGSVEFTLPATQREPALKKKLTPRTQAADIKDWLLDLTQWRRMQMDRQLEPFPAAQPSVPNVASGSLLIVGGGGMPDGLMERFVELAGGADDAQLVYVPCAEEETVSPRQSMLATWRRMGVENVHLLHTKNRMQAETDADFQAPLEKATGIWFGGGRQWNFADSYYGTTTHRLMKNVLLRGGVIGGSSAGASIQGRYLARATPIQNFDIMAPGYERGGLGFISGVAIDQHFSQRGRQKDMASLIAKYPQLLGIGLDEATAIEVRGTLATVSGKGKVFFYDARGDAENPSHVPIALREGAVYELSQRKVVEHGNSEE